MKPAITILVLAILGVMLFALVGKTWTQIRRTRTYDTMGQIRVAMDRTLKGKPLDEYNPEAETLKLFPLIPVVNGQILDGWGRPLRIVITRVETGFQVRIISSGQHSVMGTTNDLIDEVFFPDEKGVAH